MASDWDDQGSHVEGSIEWLNLEVSRLRSELEQVKRERDEWRAEAAKARASIAAMRDRLHALGRSAAPGDS